MPDRRAFKRFMARRTLAFRATRASAAFFFLEADVVVEDDEEEEAGDDFLDFLDAGRFLLRFEREFFVLERGGAAAALAAAGAAGAAGAPLELELELEEEPREERRRLLTRSAAVSPTLLASTEPNAERLLPRFFLFLLPPTT